MIALSLALAWLGCFGISATMHAHRGLIWRRTKSKVGTRRMLRALAWLCLFASVAACIKAQGVVGVGLVLWFGIFTATAFAQVLLLSYFPPLRAESRNRARR